jgi:hypothetical protein
MSIAEIAPRFETQDPLLPGTIRHLDYLAGLDIAQPRTLQELQGFLLDNFVAESFSRIIRRHRTLSPLPLEGDVVLDSRLINSSISQVPIFRGTLSLGSQQRNNNHLHIHGRPNPQEPTTYGRKYYGRPRPDEPVLFDYTYDLSIPLTSLSENLTIDVDRPLDAFFTRGNFSDIKTVDRWIYRSHADEYYKDEHDPTVFVCAVQEAATELAALLRRQNGEIRVL